MSVIDLESIKKNVEKSMKENNIDFKENEDLYEKYITHDTDIETNEKEVLDQYEKAVEKQYKRYKEDVKKALDSNRESLQKLKDLNESIKNNAQLDMVSWHVNSDYVEIPEATPINTTISPEEVKDIAAMYDATNIIQMTKTILSEYEDMKDQEIQG